MASGLNFETLRAQSGSNILIPAGHVFEAHGNVKIPNWTNSNRPTGEVGKIGYNTSQGYVEFYDGTEWKQAGFIGNDGSSADRASASGVTLVQEFPNLGSGVYWIKSAQMPNALQMYVDFTEDGGGYDFYNITSGPSFRNITSSHGGSNLGLGFWMPRSKYAWRAASRAVAALDGGNFGSYWATCYAVYKTGGGGNYTGCAMRHSSFGGGNCGDWRTTDGGRWWLRDGSFGEPNGDYTGNTFLYMYGGQIGNPYGLNDIGFNDANPGATTGDRYLVSTNTKS
jgi:hypothetical protein